MGSQSNLISVVIPFYSTEKGFLERSVKSVLKQDYQNFEIIIVDDCSPINAVDELSELLPNEKIKVFRNKVNRHGAYSRNYGIEQSNGEFIALLDADDYWDNNHLSTCIREIDDYDFIYSNIQRVIGSNVTKIEVSDIKNYEQNLMADILLDSPPQTNSFFFRKSCYPTVKFDESLKRHQDYQFFLSFCLSKYKVKKINICTSYYIDTCYKDKIIDYLSIYSFWKKNKQYTSYKKLHPFLIKMITFNLRDKNSDILAIKKISSLLAPSSLYYNLTKNTDNILAYKILTYIYYYLVIEFTKIPHNSYKLLKKFI